MSKLDDLIREFCPEGVEYMQLGAIEDAGLIKLGRGNVISKKDIAGEPGDYPIYSSSASGVGEFGRYGKYMFDDERLSWSVDGGGRFFYRHAHKYSVTNVSGWLKVLDSSRIDIKYLFYALDSAWSTKKFDYTKKAHPSVIRNEYKIPVPPLDVQKEIVNILDKFTQLEAELSAELEARRKQYEYYRKNLILTQENTQTVFLGDIATIGTGSHDTKDAEEDGDYIFYARGREPLKLNTFDFDESAIITAGDGVGVGKVFHFASGKYALHQRAYRIVPNEGVDARFIYHYLVADFARYLERTSVHASVTSLRRPMFLKYSIDLPPLEEQRRIVIILDKFDKLANDISVGIPAEINGRRKQYEYYRTKLLTFQELPA